MEYEDLVMEIKKEEEYQELVMGPKIFDLKKKIDSTPFFNKF